MKNRVKNLLASSVRKLIAGGFAVLLILLVGLAAVAFQLTTPVERGAARVQEASAKAEIATAVSLGVSDAHARVAQFALSSTVSHQKEAKSSLRRLDEALARTAKTDRADGAIFDLARSYQDSVDQTFAAVELRRASIERLQAAGAEIHTIASGIVEALDFEPDASVVRGGLRLEQGFQDADIAVSRFLGSRFPADSEIALTGLATVPPAIDELVRLVPQNRRIGRLTAALTKPLTVYEEALRSVVAADDQLRRIAGTRNAASDAVLGAAAAERDRDMQAQREAISWTLANLTSVRQLLVLAALTAVAAGLGLALLIGRALVRQFRNLEVVKTALQEKSTLLETTLANMDQGLIVATPERTVGVFNQSAMRLLDLPSGVMREGISFDVVLKHQREQANGAAEGKSRSPFSTQADLLDHPHTYELRTLKGDLLEIRSVPLPGGGALQTFTDITQRTLAENRIIYAAQHDVLTCLPNRALFAQRLQEAIAMAESDGARLAVLFLDLDRFKLVNDTLGHSAGDELLKQVANRMRGLVRATDTLARIGGDEFAVVMPQLQTLDVAVATAERLRESIRNPYMLPQGNACIGVSIGVSCYPIHANSLDQLMDLADLALYRAKAAGRDMFCVFNKELDARTQDEMILESALQFALQEQQFEISYQPIWEIAARRIVGVEALVRWRHPTKGILLPDSFIPLAERTGLIVELGRWVMEAACREATTWVIPISVSVNVSPAQLQRREFVDEVRNLLQSIGIPRGRLKLEITERQLLEETPVMIATMSALRDLGVGLAVDDFGTGHSSLSTLRSFPFTDIKIDRRFTNGIDDDGRSRGLFEAILHLARSLNLTCVAEGVETEGQLAALRRLGCEYAQGYLMGKPDSPVAIRCLIARSAHEDQHILAADPTGAVAKGF
jgi:diguanylate cyclase (GGDEF)-like protein